MALKKIFANGIFKENPVLVMMLGMCPALATSTSIRNALSMGLVTAAVLLCSNITISLIRKVIPEKIRITVFAVIASSFVSIAEMLLKAYFPLEISESLGIFIPLIAVNCIILTRAEVFASKNGIISSIVDGASMGLGFTGAIVLLAAIREVLGNGTFWGYHLFGASFEPAVALVLPAGGFIVLGLLVGMLRLLGKLKKEPSKKTYRKSRRLDANNIKYRLERGGVDA